jgi:hypothetical protein
MKPFNLDEALAGKPVVTRDRIKITELHHFKTFQSSYKVLAIINGLAHWFNENGKLNQDHETRLDLFMASEKKEGWINIYKYENHPSIVSFFHETKKLAEAACMKDRIACVKVEWES